MSTTRVIQLAAIAIAVLTVSLGIKIKAVSAAPARYASPLSSCVDESYIGSQDLLAFRNGCSEDADVFFYANSSIYGEIHVGSGSTEETGYSRSVIQRAGGMTSYACPRGYAPVDENDQLATSKKVSRYRCRY